MRASRKIVRRSARHTAATGGEAAGWHAVRDGRWGGWDVRRAPPVRVATRLDSGCLNDRLGAAGRPGSARRFVDHRRPTRARIRATNPGPLESLRPDGNRASTGNAATPISPAPRVPLDGPLAHTARAQGGEAPGGRPGDPARGAGTGAAGIDPRAEAGPAIPAQLNKPIVLIVVRRRRIRAPDLSDPESPALKSLSRRGARTGECVCRITRIRAVVISPWCRSRRRFRRGGRRPTGPAHGCPGWASTGRPPVRRSSSRRG